MFYKDLISVALAAVLGTTVVFAIEHGEVTEISGEEYRWHQIAKDVWTGVPIREWDEDGMNPPPPSSQDILLLHNICMPFLSF